MMEYVSSMTGPAFLGIYVALVVIAGLVGKILAGRDGSLAHPMPEPTRFSPRQMAAFAGTPSDVLRTALFELIEGKVLKIAGEGDRIRIKRIKNKKSGLSDPVDLMIYESLPRPVPPRDIFTNQVLMDTVKRSLDPFFRDCETLHLVQGPAQRAWIRAVTWAVLLFVGGVGCLRLVHGLSAAKPVGLLVLIMVASLYLLHLFIKPVENGKTRLGRAYLNKLIEHFEWLKDALAQGDLPKGIEPALPLSLFGPGALAGLGTYVLFTSAFMPSHLSGLSPVEQMAGHGGSGCGVGCGSGESDAGGCGGGCSGGCGGCGGCS